MRRYIPPVYEFQPWPATQRMRDEYKAHQVEKSLARQSAPSCSHWYNLPPEKPDLYGPWLRYNNGHWTACGNDEWDIAFVSATTSGPPYALGVQHPHYAHIMWRWWDAASAYAHPNPSRISWHSSRTSWHYMIRQGVSRAQHYDENGHPNGRAFRAAMSYCCDLHGCANGRGPHVSDITDPWLVTRCIRRVDTHKPIVIPRILTCEYGCKLYRNNRPSVAGIP